MAHTRIIFCHIPKIQGRLISVLASRTESIVIGRTVSQQKSTAVAWPKQKSAHLTPAESRSGSFISARELRLGPLAREVAIGRLRQPIPVSKGFSSDAVPLEVAEAIVDRTGGQPYLTQLYGFWLVEELNQTKRRRAELQDVEAVDQIVFEQAAPFFRDSLNPRGATFAVRPVIEQIVAGSTPELTSNNLASSSAAASSPPQGRSPSPSWDAGSMSPPSSCDVVL